MLLESTVGEEAQDYRSMILSMENVLLNGETPDPAVLQQLPEALFEYSPLLSEWRAEQLFRAGNLAEARSFLEIAVKGYTQQTFENKLRSSLALLAQVTLRLGERFDAETILNFLKEQHDNIHSEDVDGKALYAMARGAHVIDRYDKQKEYLFAAWEAFVRQGNIDNALHVGLDLLLLRDQPVTREEAVSILTFMEQQVNINKHRCHIWQAGQLFACCSTGEWERAAALFCQLDTNKLAYEYSCRCALGDIQSLLYRGITLDLHNRQRIEHILSRFETDLYIRFEAYELLYYAAHLEGMEEQANDYKNQMQAISQITRHPHHIRLATGTVQPLEPAASPWKVQLFNKIKIFRGTSQYQDLNWKRKKACELFVYLLLRPEFCATKEEVMEDLLGSLNVEKIANQLYVIVHQLKLTLKQELGLDSIVIMKEGLIRLKDGFIAEVDVNQYIRLLREGELLWDNDRSKALEQYRLAIGMYGDLAPEIRYVDWLDGYRGTLVDKQSDMIKKLAKHALEEEHYDLAEMYYKDWIALCPMQEEAYQGLIVFYMSISRKKEAVTLYRKWEGICETELGSEPAQELKQLVFKN